MKKYGSILLAAASIILVVAASQSIQIFSPPEPASQPGLPMFDAVEISQGFLDGLNATTGRILSTDLEVREPNFYWHKVFNLEKPDTQGSKLLWIIRFEQAARPGHYFEVWVDLKGDVLGGDQCK
jgi:hypothetical protein